MKRRPVNTRKMGRDRGASEGARSPPAMAPAKYAAMCQEILDLVGDLPERAEDFGASVSEKLQDMMEWAEEHEHVTPKMVTAAENIRDGIDRWLERD